MIQFHEPVITDREWAEPILYGCGLRSCEDTFTVLYTWHNAYRIQIAEYAGFLLAKSFGAHGSKYYFPMGAGDPGCAIAALREDARENGTAFSLVCVTPERMEYLEKTYPGVYTYTEDRDSFDYIYTVERLADLAGKKMQAKRNHINRFVENHPDWTASPVTEENLRLCRLVEERWQAEAEAETDRSDEAEADQKDENVALSLAFSHFSELGLEGIVICTGTEPVAFALGKRVSRDSYDVHFEKAIASVQGSYAIVNRETARYVRRHYPEVRYINREDDMGVEGLRKAKESYHPDFLIEKHTASEKRGPDPAW